MLRLLLEALTSRAETESLKFRNFAKVFAEKESG